jgi:hypothetical protein
VKAKAGINSIIYNVISRYAQQSMQAQTKDKQSEQRKNIHKETYTTHRKK